MKFNWGHAIILVIVTGVMGFLTLVFLSTREKIDMVTEDYYPKELQYDDQIKKIKNYNALVTKVKISSNGEINIHFPNDIADANGITGLIHFYRPSNKELDVEQEIQLNDDYAMTIPKTQFKNGKYEVIIEWQANNQAYLTKQDIYID
ncbi:FixH family protein [Carboxylicivirga sp. M1479]|uniref:FixH family protein n=1 Tax=Carboxylicivirga sp. M1479 TaxID=2594476 RepID=UPI0011779FD2|nr:FixH family protein [Carboxylicivirga sp. M1479]TRX71347.1 cytochrome C oxidase Cbb3 [Carboxylicivirga sp. M1479]